jgi:hypothetical protein
MLLFLLLAITALVSASSPPLAAEILYWPLSAAQPSQLALVNYDPSTLQSTLVSYTPPPSSDNDILRVGLYTMSLEKQWVGSLSSIAQVAATNASLTLHLGPDNQPYHVSIAPSESPSRVQALRDSPAAAPKPHLNRPVVVSPDGRHPEAVEEKSLFQK